MLFLRDGKAEVVSILGNRFTDGIRIYSFELLMGEERNDVKNKYEVGAR